MMEFRGTDAVFESQIGVERIKQAVAAVLSLPPSRVSIIDNIADYPERASADVVCLLTRTLGDFTLAVSIQCDPVHISLSKELDVVQRLVDALGVAALTPDDSPLPTSMWFVSPNATPERVSVDDSALDDGRFEIRHAPR